MNFMISAGHFLIFYIGIELATIPIAALSAFDRYKNKSAEAGIKLILSSALSSGVLLYGLSMIYGTTGTLYFSEVATRFGNHCLQILGFIFFFSGMAFKISIVPFHLWTADVYEGSPVNITSYLSVISKGAAVFILMIILFTVFPVIMATWQKTISVTSILTMTIGNLFAIRQQNLKRFLAFSSISQAGYILLGLIAGIPPVAGFFGKFFLFTAAAQKGFYFLVLIAVLNTIISLFYYLLVVKAMFINKSEKPISMFKSDFSTRFALGICVAGIVVTGFASIIFEVIRNLSFGV